MFRKLVCVGLILSLLGLTGCATSDETSRGIAAGALMGGLAGALIDGGNAWRGGVIGAVIGAAVVGSAVELSRQAAREAAMNNRQVVYQSQNYNQRVIAQPVTVYSNGCKDVLVQVYENGRLVREEMTQVCG